MAAQQFASKSLPGIAECFTDIVRALKYGLELSSNQSYVFPDSFLSDIRQYGQISLLDVQIAVGLTIFWTFLRYVLTYFVFLPWARWARVQSHEVNKLPESAWKCIWYLGAWLYTFYVCVWSGDHDFFQRPLHIWSQYEAKAPVPVGIYWIYQIQISFYMHSIYATCCMDHWRKDSIVMMFHHFLTITLISFSFACRYTNIGVLILYLHDFSDICLEFCKVNRYLKTRGGRFHILNDILVTVGFIVLASSWFLNRIWLFYLKVLHAASYGVFVSAPIQPLPFMYIFNVMLLLLFSLNIYWFSFIVLFVWKVISGQMHEIDDVREEEVLKEQGLHSHTAASVNGTATNLNGASHNGRPSAHVDSKKSK